jgi:hypothetical protein
MISKAGNAMLASHFVKKRRTVAFSVKDQDKVVQVRVLVQLLLGGLIWNLLKQPRNNIAPQSVQQSRIDLFLDNKKGATNRIIDPVVGYTPQTQPLTGYIST